MNWKKMWIMVLAAAVLATGATVAAADARCGGPGGRHGMQGPGHMFGFLHRLDLSDSQKTQVAGILKELEPEAKEAVQGMVDARIQLANTTMSGTYDEAAVRQASVQVSSYAEQLAIIRAKAVSRIMEILTPEQKATLDEMKGKISDRAGARVDAGFEHLDAWIAKHSK